MQEQSGIQEQELAFFQQMRMPVEGTDASVTVDILCKGVELNRQIRRGMRPEISWEEEATIVLAFEHFAKSLPKKWHTKYDPDIFKPLTYAVATIQNYRRGEPLPTLMQ